MKKMLIVLAFTFPMLSWATPGYWMPTAKNIKSMIVDSNSDGRVLVIIEDGVPSEYIPESCRAGDSGTLNTIDLTNEKGKAMYSMALAAYLAGKPIKLALSCTGNRPLITHMWVSS